MDPAAEDFPSPSLWDLAAGGFPISETSWVQAGPPVAVLSPAFPTLKRLTDSHPMEAEPDPYSRLRRWTHRDYLRRNSRARSRWVKGRGESGTEVQWTEAALLSL